MKAVFGDTSYYAALINPDDVSYHNARSWSETYTGRVIVTEYVLVELGGYCSRRKFRRPLLAILNELETDSHTQIVPASRVLYREGLALFADRLDKDWSLTDCISFAVMTRRKLTDALTADRHFEQAGFRALLRHEPPPSSS
jgi:predicted nucleic acid-binding protein